MSHMEFGQGEGAMGSAGYSAKSVENDREERQQEISEERFRLVVPKLPLGHENPRRRPNSLQNGW